jgi:hypothetical protein
MRNSTRRRFGLEISVGELRPDRSPGIDNWVPPVEKAGVVKDEQIAVAPSEGKGQFSRGAADSSDHGFWNRVSVTECWIAQWAPRTSVVENVIGEYRLLQESPLVQCGSDKVLSHFVAENFVERAVTAGCQKFSQLLCARDSQKLLEVSDGHRSAITKPTLFKKILDGEWQSGCQLQAIAENGLAAGCGRGYAIKPAKIGAKRRVGKLTVQPDRFSRPCNGLDPSVQ